MAALLKLTALLICINIFLYLGINYALNTGGASSDTAVRLQGDLFDLLLEDKEGFDQYMDDYVDSLESDQNVTRAYKFQLSGNFSAMPSQHTGSSVSGEAGAFSFLDALKVVWAFVATLINVGLSPLTFLLLLECLL